MRGRRALILGFGMVFMLVGCAKIPPKQLTRWDAYYARTDRPRAHVVVVPPQGSTVPMAKLIAEYVVTYLVQHNISAVVGDGVPRQGRERSFILTGVVEEKITDPRVHFRRLMRWSLSDSQGRLIASHVEGVDGTDQEWDFGSPRLLESIGFATAGPVAQMVLAETKATTFIDSRRRGVLVDTVTGVTVNDAAVLIRALRGALRGADMQVTGDPRQAAFRLVGQVEVQVGEDGFDTVRIVWRVLTMDRRELGRAVQENRLPTGDIRTKWAELSPIVAKAAAVGVEHVFGTRSGPLPGAANRATGAPPEIVLPGVPGRALPPPR